MEQRRFLVFITLSFAILAGWSFIAPRFFPPPKPANQQAANDPAAEKKADDGPVEAEKPAGEAAAPDAAAAANAPAAEPVKFDPQPRKSVTLGSPDPASGYFLSVTTTSEGASISSIELNDDRYRDLDHPNEQLRLVGTNPDTELKTLETSLPAIDNQLKALGTDLDSVDWEVVETIPDENLPGTNSAVTYRFVSPDKKLEIRKRYALQKVAGDSASHDVRDTNHSGYMLNATVSLKNLDTVAHTVDYRLQGPVGLPLENREHTSRYRSIQVGFLNDDESVEPKVIAAKAVVEASDADEVEKWKRQFKYIGVDVQYFAALLLPAGVKDIDYVQAVLVDKEDANVNHSDISFEVQSAEVSIPPGTEKTDEYSLYAGPKREGLLDPIGAAPVMEYGWFGGVARVMLALLKFMHDRLGMPYGIAIICMTILVRACLFPISMKQARGAKKMKELQPKIAELKKKYENKKEDFARAQMELFRQHNYNPFAGCLPLILQMPIFFGLYTALNSSIDLRMASFLWIDNLAAPDALFRLPFQLPFGLGGDFNLLPLITVLLFVVQQKMFMPPPTDEQTAMQQRMMMWMSLLFGVFFYHMPSGLCVYFIASSLWGLGERKLLDWTRLGEPASRELPPETEVVGSERKSTDKPAAAKEGLWSRLIAAADEAAAQAGKGNGKGRAPREKDGWKKKDGGSKPRSRNR